MLQKWEARGGMKPNLVLWIVALSVVVSVAFMIYTGLAQADEAALESCIESIHHTVMDSVKDSTLKLTVADEWTYLGSEDIKRLEEGRVFGDCRLLTSNKLIDIWGENIQIVYRSQPRFHSYPPDFRVWSKGRDRVAGTADDIIAPRGSLDSVRNLADRWP